MEDFLTEIESNSDRVKKWSHKLTCEKACDTEVNKFRTLDLQTLRVLYFLKREMQKKLAQKMTCNF